MKEQIYAQQSYKVETFLERIRDIFKTNYIQHRSAMQTLKPKPKSKRIMPAIRFTEFPTLSVDTRIGITRPEPIIDYFSNILLEKM